LPKFDAAQARFLKKHEVCRLATASREGLPHVTPVIYALDGDSFVVAIDYGTKKLANLRENPFASLVVDEYSRKHRAIMIQGRCEVFEKGAEYRRLLRTLFDRFESYRTNPWREGEAPIVRISADKVVSWGFTGDRPPSE
jgi:PPOX class probable F420-dependent enzyme